MEKYNIGKVLVTDQPFGPDHEVDRISGYQPEPDAAPLVIALHNAMHEYAMGRDRDRKCVEALEVLCAMAFHIGVILHGAPESMKEDYRKQVIDLIDEISRQPIEVIMKQ